MNVQLLIFDWDGTLSNSAGHIVAATQAAITAIGLAPRADHEISQLIGLGIVDGLRRLYPEHDTNWLLGQLMQHRREQGIGHVAPPLFAGAAESLAQLAAQGYRLAVATGMPRAGLDHALGVHQHVAPLFELTHTADETADKPNPLMLERILARTGLAPEQALMIGDTEYDVTMARRIGMPALGVACGVHDHGRLLRAGATAVVDDAAAIPGWLAARRAAN